MVPVRISSITCRDFVFTVTPVPTPWVFSWLVMMVFTPDLENQTIWRKNSHPALFKPSSILLSPPFYKQEQLNQNRKLLSQQGKKNIPFVWRVWLLSSLTGSPWVQWVPELRVSVGMWPKVEECALGALQFNFAYIEELHQGTILSVALLTAKKKFWVDFKTKWTQTL